MILRLTRGAAATNGLIAVTTDQTSTPYYGLHKPNQLEQLQLLLNSDNEIIVTLVLGQYSFSVPQVDLFIEGKQQNLANIDEIKDAFSVLFLDSSAGGGGGGTINPTDTYLPFRFDAATFKDSSIQQVVEPAAGLFEMLIGLAHSSIRIKNAGNATGDKIIKIGRGAPVIGSFLPAYLVFDFVDALANLVGETVFVGGEAALSRANLALFNNSHECFLGDARNNGQGTQIAVNDDLRTVRMGDINDGVNGTKILLDDVAQQIRVGGVNSKLFVDHTTQQVTIGDAESTVNNTYVKVNDFTQRINVNSTADALIGDTLSANNGTYIHVDDANQSVNFNNNSALRSYNFANLRTYSSNAAAVLAGLQSGDIYRNTSLGASGINLLCIVP